MNAYDVRRRLVESYAEFLKRWRWDWFATLTFRGVRSSATAKTLFNRWIADVENLDGESDFRWVRVTEKGPAGTTPHFHVLVGGLKTARDRGRCERRWSDLAGDARVEQFDPEQDGILYMLKTLQPHKDFDIDMKLDSRVRRARLGRKAGEPVSTLSPVSRGGGMKGRKGTREEKRLIRAEAIKLLRDPLFLYKAGQTIEELGVVGEQRNRVILFLAGLSKDLVEPVSVLVRGPSSSGKSKLVRSVIKLFPPESVITRASLSPKALPHGKEPLGAKIFYLLEYRGPKDAQYLRLQQSEGDIAHEFATVVGASPGTQVAKRTGMPVVFTTTTLEKVFEDDENRFLSIHVDDSASQTLAIARALVTGISKGSDSETPVWHEAIRLLGKLRVTAQYPSWLRSVADHSPTDQVRIRRDLPRFLTLLRCVALCRGYAGAATHASEVMINFADYCVAYALLNRVLASTVYELHEREIEIGSAVRKLFNDLNRSVTVRDIARELNWKESLVYKFAPHAIRHSLVREEPGTRQTNLKPLLPGPNTRRPFLPSPGVVFDENPEIGQSASYIDPLSGIEEVFRRPAAQQGVRNFRKVK